MNKTSLKNNLRIIGKMSIVDIKRRFKTSIFSWVWLLVAPLLMIFTYWFGLGSADPNATQVVEYVTASGKHEYNWFAWILIGAFTWSYCGDVIVSGPSSTSYYSWMPKSFGVSPSIPPFITNLSKVVTGLPWLILAWIVAIIINATDASTNHTDVINLYALEVPVVLLLTIIAMTVYSYALAPLVAISKDLKNIFPIIPGLLSWISGVFIQPTAALANDLSFRSVLIQINPLNFVINGIRSTMLGYDELFTPNNYVAWYSILSFFVCFGILGLFGWIVNKSSRKFIIDII